MITHRDLRKTKKLIDRHVSALLHDTPQLLKLWGKEKCIDVVTNYLLMMAFKKLPPVRPRVIFNGSEFGPIKSFNQINIHKHKHGKNCIKCNSTVRYIKGNRCVDCARRYYQTRKKKPPNKAA